MRTTCNWRTEVENWAKLGSDAPCPAEITEHAAQCASCSDLINEVVGVRNVFRESDYEFSEARHARVRNRLVAAATRQQREFHSPRLTRQVGTRWAIAAALVLIVGASAFVAFKKERPSKADPLVATVAEVTLVDSAIGHTLQSGRNEVYELVQGFAEFSVKHLAPNQRYRVLVGDDEVEVRGTRFQVVAQQRHLHSVRVIEGRVQVTRSGRTLQLDAGQQWIAQLPNQNVEPGLPPPTPADFERSNADASTPANPTRHHASHAADKAPEADAELYDVAFKAALSRLRSGDAAGALADFNTLLAMGIMDAGRKADVLYWSAVASYRSGSGNTAEKRLRQFLAEQPNGWHAPDAALMLGELLLARGNSGQAKPWLERAASANRPSTSAKARELLAKMGPR